MFDGSIIIENDYDWIDTEKFKKKHPNWMLICTNKNQANQLASDLKIGDYKNAY